MKRVPRDAGVPRACCATAVDEPTRRKVPTSSRRGARGAWPVTNRMDGGFREYALDRGGAESDVRATMKQRFTNVRNSAGAGTRSVERALDVLRAVGESRMEPG